MKRYIIINESDNVGVALTYLTKGEEVGSIIIRNEIESGHKFALKSIKKGEFIIKYGMPIGKATNDINTGEILNHNNITTTLSGIEEYQFTPIHTELTKKSSKRTFMGYLRKDGRVGIRNEIWIIPTVGCINGTAEKLAKLSNIKNCYAFTHNYGCSQLGTDHQNTKRIIKALATHPNAGGVLIIGLGCENNQIPTIIQELGDTISQNRVKFIETQKVDGDEIEYGLSVLKEIETTIKEDKRTSQPISSLTIGLKCGGSDGFSGITANPLLGAFSDLLISHGGSTILTEVPEMFGAETILMNRCKNIHIFNKTVSLINNFKEFFISNKQPIYENPSPGNKAGGISTLEEKSMGCTQKCGKSTVVDVLDYGEKLTRKGLNLLYSPGNDLVSSTALGASGCQIVLFTTGRGTPFGSFVPTIKISTNSDIAIKKPHWIDFDAGTLLHGKEITQLCNELYDYIINIANGKKTNNEKNEFRDLAIFKTGITL